MMRILAPTRLLLPAFIALSASPLAHAHALHAAKDRPTDDVHYPEPNLNTERGAQERPEGVKP